MSLRKINEKMKEKERKIKFSVNNTFNNSMDSGLFCDCCHKRLRISHMVLSAFLKKKGDEYVVKCRKCNHLNIRMKGAIGDKIDSDWDKYGV